MDKFITLVTDNGPAILIIAGAAVALLKAIAVITPSNVDNKIAKVLGDALNLFRRK